MTMRILGCSQSHRRQPEKPFFRTLDLCTKGTGPTDPGQRIGEYHVKKKVPAWIPFSLGCNVTGYRPSNPNELIN